jgi:hypothetical protein
MIDPREFEPKGWFGIRGLGGKEGRRIVEERSYEPFDPGDYETILGADDRPPAGFVKWLADQSQGGYVIVKRGLPGEPDPLALPTYWRAEVKMVREDEAYDPTLRDGVAEAVALELGERAAAALPVDEPHVHVESAKYLLSPNRAREARPHDHRRLIPQGFEPRADVLRYIVEHPRTRSKDVVAEFVSRDGILGQKGQLTERDVTAMRELAAHIRAARP